MFKTITRPEFIMILGPLILLILVIEMVRRRRIREDYALLWLATFAVLVVLSMFHDTLLQTVAHLMGIDYAPAAMFVIGFGLFLLVMLQFSVVITRVTQENKQAAQRIALLSARVRELERAQEADGSVASAPAPEEG